MAIISSNGTPFVGYVSLTNAAPGPVTFALVTVMGQANYTLQANERVNITNITVSSSDGTGTPLITVDTGGGTPTKFVSAYVNTTQQLQPVQISPGMAHGIFGVVPRATANAVTAAKTVEIVIKGFISRTA